MENLKTNTASINPENPCDTSVCGGGGNLLINKTKRPFRAKTHKFFGAFTLAEVLVTLTILGIVATIVVPNLMQQYKKTQTISRLKMAYSILDNMTQQSYVENGYPPVGLGTVKIQDVFHSYFGKYLSIAKDCGTATNKTKDTGCFKSGNYRYTGDVFVQDKDGNKLERDMFYTLDGVDVFTGGYEPSYYYKVLLKNGMGLGVYNNTSIYNGYVFVIDIDGPNRGESKLGQDVFQFIYYAPNQGIYGTGCQYPGLFKGAYSPSNVQKGTCDVTREHLLKMCSVGGSATGATEQNGAGCSGLIIKDGWKISKDYPWDYAQKKIK